jgi:adenine-specific DNA-methyltransferase
MIKDILEQNEDIKANSKQIDALKEYFPSCFKADGSFDVERLKTEIADKTNLVQEGYELKFLGKSYAKLLASTDTTTVIEPNEEHNNLPENAKSENIYISGDNLDGLKHLLKSYSKSIKCIYIDPPYNTGSDGFVYFDNFKYTKENLQEKLSLSEEEAERILDLTKRGSASHSAWLMFMYSRLLLARDLLNDNGVIFISIDDNEQANLKLLCDDVFGEENFQGQFIVNATPNARDYGHIGKMHEYILFYSRDNFQAETYELEVIEKTFKYTDESGGYNIHPLYNSNEKFHIGNRKNLFYPFYLWPNSSNDFYEISLEKKDGWIEIFPPLSEKNKIQFVWRWGKDKSLKNINKEIIGYKTNQGEFRIVQKMRHTTKLIRSILENKEFTTRRGTADIEELFINKVFDFPKPVSLIITLLKISTKDDNIICDFFSGSATTAQAVMELNAMDEGRRKFISVQLPEVLTPKVDSQKTAFEFLSENNLPKTLDYIGIERIKRAATKIKQEHANIEIDLGFKHFKLVEPNQNTLDKLESFDKAGMLADTSILNDFGKSTILASWLNADGYGLTAKAKAIDLAGYTAYYFQKDLYLIDNGFTLESMKALLNKYEDDGHFNPENLVLFGYSFPDWSINEMIEKNLRILNDTDKNLKINFSVRY